MIFAFHQEQECGYIPRIGVRVLKNFTDAGSAVQALKYKTDYAATLNYDVTIQLWFFASRHLMMQLNFVKE